jgi:hypothetical protein
VAVKVAVPESAGPELAVSYGGDPPVKYRVTKEGLVEVADEHLDEFLAAIPGAKPAP